MTLNRWHIQSRQKQKIEFFLHMHSDGRHASDFPYSSPEATQLPSVLSALFWVLEAALFWNRAMWWAAQLRTEGSALSYPCCQSCPLPPPPLPHSNKQAADKHKQAWSESPVKDPRTASQVDDMPYTLPPLN